MLAQLLQLPPSPYELCRGCCCCCCCRHGANAAATAPQDEWRPLLLLLLPRTWLLLLRAFIQLPMMTSVLAWVSSIGGTGYLHTHTQRQSSDVIVVASW